MLCSSGLLDDVPPSVIHTEARPLVACGDSLGVWLGESYGFHLVSLAFGFYCPIPEHLQGLAHFPAVDVPHEQLVFDQGLPRLVCGERVLLELLCDIG